MHATVLVFLGLTIGIWILAILMYRLLNGLLKLKDKKKWIRVTTLSIGISITWGVSVWLLLVFGASVFLHTLSSPSKEHEIARQVSSKVLDSDFQQNFVVERKKFNDKELVTEDSTGSDLQYYLYTKEEANIKEGQKVVIIQHGLAGSRFSTYRFIQGLQESYTTEDGTETESSMKDALFIVYDSRGWNDAVDRGKFTLGKLEGADLYNVILDVKDKLKPSEVILYGYSMGSGAVYSTLDMFGDKDDFKNTVSKVIIDSGYHELERQLSFHAQRILGGLADLILDSFLWLYSLDVGTDILLNAIDKVSKLDVPLMLIHARKDAIVNFVSSCEMNKAREENDLDDSTYSWFIDEKGHVDFIKEHNEEFKRNVQNFINWTDSDPALTDIGTEGCSK